MDFKKYYLDEIMKLDIDNSSENNGMLNTLLMLRKYVEVKFLTNESNELYYQCEVNDILNSNISNEELITLRNNGWEYSKDKACLIKKI